MALAEPVRLVCREDKLVRLTVELAIQRLDMVLADRPMPAGTNVKGYSHKLGDCGITFFAEPGTRGAADATMAARPRCGPLADSRQGGRRAGTVNALAGSPAASATDRGGV